MSGAPREGITQNTFTRDLRVNASRPAPSAAAVDETEVLRSPTNHQPGLGAAASFDEHSLAKTRQRRDLAGPRSPLPPYNNAAAGNLNTSPSHPFTHAASPPFGAERTTSKPLLSPTGALGRRRSRTLMSNNNLRMTLVLVAGGFIVFFLMLYRGLRAPVVPESQPASACEAAYDTLEPHSHPLHHTMHEGEHGDFPMHAARASIALVTMADTRKVPLPKNLAYLTDIKPGSQVNILEVVWRNRQEYADRHGYTLVNGTALVEKDRPPSWYKLKIVESVLDQYDWVFYLDPDAWITNPEIPLEVVLPAPGGADFVVTEDAAGANAGSWVLRSSDWSREFLSRWWAMDSFIRPPGDTKSGDNDALKHLLGEMSAAERARRVAVPPQCALNSYLWRPSVRQWSRWFTSSSKVRSGIWRPGHLLVHLAGWDNYKGLMQLQKLFLSSHDLTRRSSSGLPLPRLSRKHLLPDEIPAAAIPKLGTPMPRVAAAGSNSSASASTAEFTTSELPKAVAGASAGLEAEAAAVGGDGSGVAGVSMRRRASALLGATDSERLEAPSSKKDAASLRAGALLADKVTHDDGTGCSGDEAASSGCTGVDNAAADSEDSAESGSGDYAIATEEELADLNVPMLTDQDTDDLQALEEIAATFDPDADDDDPGAEGSSDEFPGDDFDADFENSVFSDQEEEDDDEYDDEEALVDGADEDFVFEIARDVAKLLKQRKQKLRDGVAQRGRGIGRRGVGFELEDLEDEPSEEEDDAYEDEGGEEEEADGESAEADFEDENGVEDGDGMADDLVGDQEDDEADGEEQQWELSQQYRDVKSGRREFLKRRANRLASEEPVGIGRQRGRSLMQATDDTLPEQPAVDTESSMQLRGAERSLTQTAAKKTGDAKNRKMGSGSTPQWAKSKASFANMIQSVTSMDPPPEERGGRPYEPLEEFPGVEEDYEEHSEEVHARTNSMASLLTVKKSRGTRHSLRDMNTDEIDSIEEDTERSAEVAKQLFGLER